MTNSVWFWWIALVVWLIAEVSSDVKAYRRKGWKGLRYSLKHSWNVLSLFLNMILANYFIVIAVIPEPSLINWVNTQLSKTINNTWVFHLMPTAYSLLIIIVCWWIILGGLVPKIKLNDEEKQWEKINNDKFKNKVKEWLHIKPKVENVVK